MDWRSLLALFPLLVVSCIYAQGCDEPCDIYIVLTCSDTMADLPALMVGARNGLQHLFDAIRPDRRSNCGPRVSLCCYGTTAEEQITPGGPLDASLIRTVGGISRLDLGIECARNSSQANRRPGVCQCMALIVSEDPLGFQGADYTDAAREQIRMAREEGFCRITLTTVSVGVYYEMINEFADPGYWVHIMQDFIAFEERAANNIELRDQFCYTWRVPCGDRYLVEAVARQCASRQIRNVRDWRAVCE